MKKINIKNGPTLYLIKDNRRHSVFFEIVTKFGGMTKDFISEDCEYHFHDGIAHILEHYVVENNSYGNFLKILGDKQMYTNASTDNMYTRYYFESVEDYLFGINSILNGIYNVQFSEEKLNKLKNPIFQEIRGKMNNKFYYSNIAEMSNLFYSTSFKSIGGTIEEVNKTTINDLEVCYKTFYQPSNQIIFIGGNFDYDEVIECINNFYNKLNFDKIDFELIKNKELNTVVKKEELIEFPTQQDYVDICFKIDFSNLSCRERLDYDFYLVYFFNMFFSPTSKIYKKLVDEKIITGGIGCSNNIMLDYLIISIGTFTDYRDKFIEEVFNTINNLKDFSEEIFELNKKNTIISLILRDENIMHTLIPFIDNVLYYDYPYLDKISDIENMNFNDFVKAIKKLDFSNYTITTITNK